MHVKGVQPKKMKREATMNYRDNYMDFEWKRIEGESALVEESPLDAMVRREDMRQLSESLINLTRLELVCVMMMHYDEIEKSVSDVQGYIKNYYGKDASKYKVCKFQNNGLKKIRTRLRHVYGWDR